MVNKPNGVLENRFSVPPEYAAAWLTDFQPDDGKRFFGSTETASIQKTGRTVHIEAMMPFGRIINDVTLVAPTHWSADERMLNKKGRVIAITHLNESVRPDGTGAVHRVEVFLQPQGLGARILFFFAGRFILKSLRRGFDRVRVEMERQYASGAPPL